MPELFCTPNAQLEGRKFKTGNAIVGCAYDFERHKLAVFFKPEVKCDPPRVMVYSGVPPRVWKAFPTGLTALQFYLTKLSSVFLFEHQALADQLGFDISTPDWLPDHGMQAMQSVMQAKRAADEEKRKEAAAYNRNRHVYTKESAPTLFEADDAGAGAAEDAG